MVVLGSETGRAARRELHAATARLNAAVRGRDWSARALREAASRITSDAVIALYGRVLLHHDRLATPSGTFALCGQAIAGVESARVIATSRDPRLALAADAARRAPARQVFLYVATPAGHHLEPCKADEHIKARVFASRVTSAVRTLEFDVDPDTRLRDLAARYELLEGPHAPVRVALAELRALELRLREDDRLPRRYRPPADPPAPPPLRA
ncbi:MAG TPA: hypothetical protein VGK92_10070 [Gaiellales bacterium]|jgi:hypothetical protein